MKEKIYKKNGNLIIEVPLKTERFNPWVAGPVGEMNNIVGVIAGDEMSLAHWIDMDYKDKEDQISASFYNWYGSREEFEDLCNKLGIDIYVYPACSECQKPIYGTFTINSKGENQCFECELKENK